MSPSRKKRREQRATYGLEYGNDRKVKILPTTKPGFLRSAYEVLTGEAETDDPHYAALARIEDDLEDTAAIDVRKHKIIIDHRQALEGRLDAMAKEGWVLHSISSYGEYGTDIAAVMIRVEPE